jgi:hypothetical protein
VTLTLKPFFHCSLSSIPLFLPLNPAVLNWHQICIKSAPSTLQSIDAFHRHKYTVFIKSLIHCCHRTFQQLVIFFTDAAFMQSCRISNGLVAVLQNRCFFTGLFLQSPGFNARPVHVGFVVDKVALG